MSIQGNVSLMLLDIDTGSPHHEKLKKIETYIKKGAEFTRHLISFARGGKYYVELTDINNIVRSTSGIFGRTRKQIRICLHLEENMWRVEADQSQIELVLMNLYINAWQAMTDGGELHLETGNVILDEQEVRPYNLPAGRYVRICVRDNGPGIDKAIQEKIFDPFFTTHGMGKGTGLGLSAVYGIIKNHKGIITVSSEEKQGAAFYIFLPASDHSACTADRDVRKSPLAQKTILFVDDEAMIVDVARQLLEKKGYRVLTAGNGRESLDIFKQEKNRIDLVILDMVMPVMGGMDTYICLKTMKPDVKALLSSGYSLDKEAETILDLGCNGFIQKPYTIRDLTGKINEILDMP
ncbi:MAG: response regulator [Desulfobacterales bacterium]|nr:response regulator [Desulfobacterales bacterium]